jgi:hypothetical protein
MEAEGLLPFPQEPATDLSSVFSRLKKKRTTTRKGKQTNIHARNSKLNEENRTGKHKWKRAKCNHVQVKPAKQIPAGIRK